MELLSLSRGRSSWRTSLVARSKKNRLYSQARLSKMADSRSKNINMNRKKSVKKNRNPIRLCILPFYTIIFTTPFKSVEIVAWLSQNHRTTNPAREPHIIWQRPLFSFFPFHRAPRPFFFFLPSLLATQRGLCGGWSALVNIRRKASYLRSDFVNAWRHARLVVPSVTHVSFASIVHSDLSYDLMFVSRSCLAFSIIPRLSKPRRCHCIFLERMF